MTIPTETALINNNKGTKISHACLMVIYEELQRIAPWSESNDMDIVDEIVCGLGLLAQDRDTLAAENKALRRFAYCVLEACAPDATPDQSAIYEMACEVSA